MAASPPSGAFPVLYVADLPRARAFYAAAFPARILIDAPRYCELESGELHLGLLEVSALPALLGPGARTAWADGAPRVELYVRFPRGAAAGAIAALEAAGAPLASALAERDWGERVAYLFDPDGHVLAVAEEST